MSQPDQPAVFPPPRPRHLHRCVSFSLASERYCIPVDQVLQILRRDNLIDIPTPPLYVEGVINLRGDIIPVINLRARLQIPAAQGSGAPDAHRRRVVVIKVGNHSYGLDVDDVREIVDIAEEELRNDAAGQDGRAQLIRGVVERADGVHLMLDLARMFDAPRETPGLPAGAA